VVSQQVGAVLHTVHWCEQGRATTSDHEKGGPLTDDGSAHKFVDAVWGNGFVDKAFASDAFVCVLDDDVPDVERNFGCFLLN
jgi:hypothetical protein